MTDVKRSLDYYVKTLGWEDPWSYGDPPNFAGCYGFSEMEMRLVGQPGDVRGYPLHVTATDVDHLCKLHRQRGVTVIRGLGSQTWNEYGYVVEDLNGYHIRFTERIPDQPHESAKKPRRSESCKLTRVLSGDVGVCESWLLGVATPAHFSELWQVQLRTTGRP